MLAMLFEFVFLALELLAQLRSSHMLLVLMIQHVAFDGGMPDHAPLDALEHRQLLFLVLVVEDGRHGALLAHEA